jgi:hypothetical protein
VCCMRVCRAQSDKIFSQQSALGKAHEELRLLREQLEGRQAQQSVIEAEISRQVGVALLAVHTACLLSPNRRCISCVFAACIN